METQAILFIALAILFASFSRVLFRYIMKKVDSVTYSMAINFSGSILFLPLMLMNFPSSINYTWLFLLLGGLVWIVGSLANFKSFKVTDVSISEPLKQTTAIWVLIFGILFLRESVTLFRVIGVFVIFIGSIVLVWHPVRRLKLSKEIIFVLLTSIALAATAITDKFVLRYFPVEFYVFFAYFIPSLFFMFYVKNKKEKIKEMLSHRNISVFISFLVSACAYFFIVKAFSVADVTFVSPILNLTVVLVTLSGIFLLKERENIAQKILGSAIVVIGAILLGF